MVSQGFFSGSESAEKRRFAGQKQNNENFYSIDQSNSYHGDFDRNYDSYINFLFWKISYDWPN